MNDDPINDPMRPTDPYMFSLQSGMRVMAVHAGETETFTGTVLSTGFDGVRGEHVDLDTGEARVVIRLGVGWSFLEL